MKDSTKPQLFDPISRSLLKLGSDITDARRRRRLPVAVVAERASISRITLSKIEAGAGGVSIRNVAAVLYALGMLPRLADLADARHDEVGMALEEERLPKRIRLANNSKK